MNKTGKWNIYILTCVVIFLSGYFLSKIPTSQNSTGFCTPENYPADGSNKEEPFLSLTNNEIIFLEEHLFGQWRFSERLFELDESHNTAYNTTYNISDLGSEELKKNIVIHYDKDWIQFAIPVTQNSFTSAKDMFLFGKNGGFLSVKEPVYSIEKMDSDIINLSNVCTDTQQYNIQLFGAENFLKIKYYTQYDLGDQSEFKQGQVKKNFSNIIYINPNSKDTVYVDFCGLWRMERDEKYYGPGGKSKY